jgi:hypothetical protein
MAQPTPFDNPQGSSAANPFQLPEISVTPSGVTPVQGPSDIQYATPSPYGGGGDINQQGTPSTSINNKDDVPYVAGASEGSDPTINIDKRVPRYDPNFVDKNDNMGDIYKYLSVHEQTEKPLMQQGMPYDQAHAQATAAEKAAVQADGMPWDKYTNVIDGYAKETENEHPTHTPPDLFQGPYQQNGDMSLLTSSANATEANPNEPTDDDIQRAVERSKITANLQWGSLTNAIAPVYQSIIDFINIGLAPTNALEGGVDKVLTKLGMDNLATGNRVDANKFFDSLGIVHGYPGQNGQPETIMGEAGAMVWSTVLTSLGTLYGAAEVNAAAKVGAPIMSEAINAANTFGSRVAINSQMFLQNWAKAITENPQMHFVMDQLAQAGATIGGQAMQRKARAHGVSPTVEDIANASGSFAGSMLAGGVVGPMASLAAKPVAGLGKYMQRKLTQGVISFLDEIGAYQKGSLYEPYKPARVPAISEDLLDHARTVEAQAREAGDHVVEARKQRDMQAPGSSQWKDANAKMQDALKAERVTTGIADDVWDEIPKQVRGKYSREQTALRAKFAQTNYPQAFANDQVTGDLANIDNAMRDILTGLQPDDMRLGLSGQSSKLANMLWKVRGMGEGIMEKYWDRTPLNDKFTKVGPVLKAIDKFVADRGASGYNENEIPQKEVAELYHRFGALNVDRPTLGWVKGYMTNLRAQTDAAYRRGDARLAGNYYALRGILYNAISAQFPNNTELQQARAVSAKFFSLFDNNSELANVFKYTDAYTMKMHPEDVVDRLMKRERGMADALNAVAWVQHMGMVNPEMLTPQDRQQLQATQQQAQQSIQAYITQYAKEKGSDPSAVSKMIGDPAFQRQIGSLGKTAGDIRDAAQNLRQFIDQRQAIEKSALAKYMKGDPDKAFNIIVNSTNPAAMAKMVMDGTAGVGGFKTDPEALSGFKAQALTRFYNDTQGHFGTMKDTLNGPMGRMLQTVLSPSEYTRLENIVDRIGAIEAESAQKKAYGAHVTLISQYLALKALHWMPKWMEVGEGGSLKRASLVSGFAKEVTEGLMKDTEPNETFKLAISNPAMERMLFSKIPTDIASARLTRATIREASIMEQGLLGTYRNWLSFGKGPGPTDVPEDTSSILGGVIPKAQAEEPAPPGATPEMQAEDQRLGASEKAMAPPFAMTRGIRTPYVAPPANTNTPMPNEQPRPPMSKADANALLAANPDLTKYATALNKQQKRPSPFTTIQGGQQ